MSLNSKQPFRESQSGPSVNWKPSAIFSSAAPPGSSSRKREDRISKLMLSPFITSSAPDRPDANVAKRDRAVITLEHDRAGLFDLLIQSSPGGVREGGVVDDLHPIQL